jgi:putative Mg2+ transporter-C (MgtC) family protein
MVALPQSQDLVILARLVLAVLLGGLVGYERELADKPAGLRTHMLVAAAATLLISLGGVLLGLYAGRPFLNADPVRMIEAIIVGISFLGAGTIFRSRRAGQPVEGLTTAASILFTAVIGIAVALAQYTIAVGATVIVILITAGLGHFSQHISARRD